VLRIGPVFRGFLAGLNQFALQAVCRRMGNFMRVDWLKWQNSALRREANNTAAAQNYYA